MSGKETSTIAAQRAGQAWCTPETSHIYMIPELAQAFAEILDEYIGAIQWMSAASDFDEDGQAHLGWVKLRKKRLLELKIAEEPEIDDK